MRETCSLPSLVGDPPLLYGSAVVVSPVMARVQEEIVETPAAVVAGGDLPGATSEAGGDAAASEVGGDAGEEVALAMAIEESRQSYHEECEVASLSLIHI